MAFGTRSWAFSTRATRAKPCSGCCLANTHKLLSRDTLTMRLSLHMKVMPVTVNVWPSSACTSAQVLVSQRRSTATAAVCALHPLTSSRPSADADMENVALLCPYLDKATLNTERWCCC